MTCRRCGCDDEHACVQDVWMGPCYWVEEELCSYCDAELADYAQLVWEYYASNPSLAAV